MHLMELLALRPVPAAGLYLSLTRRCPLSCAHCSTNSTLQSEEVVEEEMLRFVSTITPDSHPEIVFLSGGEPLLRPKLVSEITRMAHDVGSRVVLITGMFFAREAKVPPLIQQALANLDHVMTSLDIFHERQVPRANVLKVLRSLVDNGQEVSIQVAGWNERDPYLKDVTDQVREYFNDRVPMLAESLKPIGRAKNMDERESLKGADQLPDAAAPLPCVAASWPVVAWNGAIVACCNEALIDGEEAPHLHFGHIATDNWPSVRERYLNSPMMRALRTFGPLYVNNQYGAGKITCSGYCPTCHKLSADPAIAERLEKVMARSTTRFVERQVFVSQQERVLGYSDLPRYASLVTLGS